METGRGWRCELLPTAPQARNAVGTASVDPGTGEVTLELRGLPDPSCLGRDPTTGRAFDLYEGWLSDPCSGGRVCIGSFTRDGSIYRLQLRPPVDPLTFTSLTVSAEETSCPRESSGVVVMAGCLCPASGG